MSGVIEVVHECEILATHGLSAALELSSACEWSTLEVDSPNSNHLREIMEDSNMPRVKQASKKKRVTNALPALGAAGLTFSLVGGASAAVAPVNDQPQTSNYSPSHQITLGEEEIADVSLATFYVFDKESSAAAKHGVQEARGCGCRGCGGCRGCRGCRGCGGRGCGGCGCGWGGACCLSWGACRIC
jgi:hypothetical protein